MTSSILEKQLSSLDPPVLVTDGNERAALAVTRGLGQVGIPVIVAAETEYSLAGTSRYCTDKWKYPSPLRDPLGFIESIKHAIQVNGISSVFSISDSTTQVLARVKEELGLAGAAIPPWDSYDLVSDKYRLMELAKQLDVPIPDTLFVPDGNVEAIAEQITQYPVVVKPGRSLAQVEKSWTKTTIHFVSSRNELLELYGRTSYLSSPSLIQRRIEGTGQGIFGLFDHGKPLALFAHRRIREKPPAGGVSVFRESIAMPEPMTSHAVKLLEQVKWHGVAMVEFKVDRESGVPMLMEINGRFWGSLQLAIDAGLNVPHLLYRMTKGASEVVPRDSYRVGIKSRWLLGDLDHLLLRLTRSRESLDLPRTAESRWRCLMDFCKFSEGDLHYEIERWDDLGPAKLEYRAWLTEVTGVPIWGVLRAMKKGLGYVSAPVRAARRLYHRWTTHVPGTVTSVLFLCHGNICRSPFAEMYFQSLLKRRGVGLTVRSAGLDTTPGKPAHWNTRTSARELHISLDDHATTQLDADLVSNSDLIVVMEVGQKKRVLSLYPESKGKVVLLGCFDAKGPLEIGDPYGRPIENFRSCFSQIVRCCDNLAKELMLTNRNMGPSPAVPSPFKSQ
ncbi:MAG TPA: ATP-grasp domain-containing protein [Nitrospira sp.]|nr:ATP-grasp domain-containing protein [Nitrospira sp.]